MARTSNESENYHWPSKSPTAPQAGGSSFFVIAKGSSEIVWGLETPLQGLQITHDHSKGEASGVLGFFNMKYKGIGSGSHFKFFQALTSYELGMKSLKHIFYSFFFSDYKIMYSNRWSM